MSNSNYAKKECEPLGVVFGSYISQTFVLKFDQEWSLIVFQHSKWQWLACRLSGNYVDTYGLKTKVLPYMLIVTYLNNYASSSGLAMNMTFVVNSTIFSLGYYKFNMIIDSISSLNGTTTKFMSNWMKKKRFWVKYVYFRIDISFCSAHVFVNRILLSHENVW